MLAITDSADSFSGGSLTAEVFCLTWQRCNSCKHRPTAYSSGPTLVSHRSPRGYKKPAPQEGPLLRVSSVPWMAIPLYLLTKQSISCTAQTPSAGAGNAS